LDLNRGDSLSGLVARVYRHRFACGATTMPKALPGDLREPLALQPFDHRTGADLKALGRLTPALSEQWKRGVAMDSLPPTRFPA